MSKIEELITQISKVRNSLSTDRLDMSFGEIMNMYERDEIIINPNFQRLFRWDINQKTRFIESLIIGIPVPPIFVAEDQDGRWELVDGLQRISTVFSFFGLLKNVDSKNDWILESGEIITFFQNLACKDLPLKLQLNIKRASCRIEIIKWNSAFDMRYELFNRLNTGGTILTDQEIRNAIFRGSGNHFYDFMKEMADNKKFITLINPTAKQTNELYLDELVLRFCSLLKAKNVTSNISSHMTRYMKEVVSNSGEVSDLSDIFKRVVQVLHPLGKQIFRGKNKVFSTSLYDCVMYGIATNIDRYETYRTDEILDRINSLKESKEFTKASGSASASGSRITRRIEVAKEIFSN